LAVRWWIQTNPPYLMSVDNAVVKEMDYSDLLAAEPDLWMAQWAEGKGEIERLKIEDDNSVSNLNGLRETFIDVTPYAPFFDQFLEKITLLTLPQAKKVKVDLINVIFEGKRQAPFHYPIAAGDYWWDASDTTMGASTNAALQNTIAKVNELVSRLNDLVNTVLNVTMISQINTNIAGGVNSVVTQYNAGVVNVGNSLRNSINASVVTPTNAGFNDLNTYTTLIAQQLLEYIRTTLLGTFSGGGNTVNSKLRQTTFEAQGIAVAAPGLAGDIAGPPFNFSSNGNRCASLGEGFSGATAISGLTALPWTNLTNVQASSQQWIPIGATAPVNVTQPEQQAIMSGITARTNDLNVKRNNKIIAVNALTTIPAVIAYDVTAGW
jgi:hypothetical protein